MLRNSYILDAKRASAKLGLPSVIKKVQTIYNHQLMGSWPESCILQCLSKSYAIQFTLLNKSNHVPGIFTFRLL